MKHFKYLILLIYIFFPLMFSCRGGKVETFESFRGEQFSFSSPMTSIYASGDSLLIGTGRGIVSFNPATGLFKEEMGANGTIYDIETNQSEDKYFIAVQDGGVRCGDKSFYIRGKKSFYSPYDILIDYESGFLYGATSNGVYGWDLLSVDKEQWADTTLMSINNAEPYRFYGIAMRDDRVVFAGDSGVFAVTGNDIMKLSGIPIISMKDGGYLAKNGEFYSRLGGDAKPIIMFQKNPVDFVVQEGYVYAVSLTSVEIADLSGNYYRCIDLPEDTPLYRKNKSLRNICAIAQGFLYVTPGGNSLYRIPLGGPSQSESIVSLIGNGEGTVYALSADNDLYFSRNRHEFKYVRSFKDEQVTLLAAFRDTLIASVGGQVLYLTGDRMQNKEVPFFPLAENKITCHMFTNGHMYEGRTDCIRVYGPESPDGRQLNVFDDEKGRDYYPIKIDVTGGGALVFATLHDGVFAEGSDGYYRILDKDRSGNILDISTVDETTFVLAEKGLFRFRSEGSGPVVEEGYWSRGLLGKEASFFNRVVASSKNEVFLFSDNFRFCRGIHRFSIDTEKNFLLDETSVINDAIFLPESRTVAFCGDMGVRIGDVRFVIRPPGALARLYADTYWWGIPVGIITVLLVGAVFVLFFPLLISSIKVRKQRKKDDEEKIAREGKINCFFAKANNLSSVVGCDELAEEIKVDKQKYAEQVLLYDELIDAVLSKKQELMEKQKKDFKDYQTTEIEKLAKPYKSSYIAVLLDELCAISLTHEEFDQNIKSFSLEKEANDGNGKICDRLEILDKIGELLEGATFAYYGTKIELTEGNKLATKQLRSMEEDNNKLVKLFKKYIEELDSKNKDLAEKIDELEKTKKFLCANDVAFYEGNNQKPKLSERDKNRLDKIEETIASNKNLTENLSELYTNLSEYMLDKFYKLADSFFKSYTAAEGRDKEEFRAIFKDAKKDVQTNQRFFLMFPVFTSNAAQKWLFGDNSKSFHTRKNEAKRPLTEGKTKSFRLHSLADKEECGGLLSLIARAGLKKLQD